MLSHLRSLLASTFTIECLLPELLPYSVEEEHGFVRYKAEATLDIPWGPDYEAMEPITIVRYDDLNLVQSPNYRQPCEVEGFQTFGCMCWESDALIMTMRLLKTGFGLGDKIPIHLQMVNKSTSNVSLTEFRLEKIEQCNSSTMTGTFASLASFKIGRGVRAGQTADFVEYLEIPQNLATSSDRFCRVFQIKYQINFKFASDGYGEPPDMKIGITIGDVGITDDYTLTAAAEHDSRMHTAATLSNVESHQNDLPPSFDDVIGLRT